MRSTDGSTSQDASRPDDSLHHTALAMVRSALEAQAAALSLTLAGADMQHMLAAAGAVLRTMPRDQLAALTPASSALQSLTATSFNIGLAPEAQRAQALARDQTSTIEQTASRENTLQGQTQTHASRLRASRDGGEPSGRYADVLGGGITAEIGARMHEARAAAMRLGAPWAANQPELLKLGAAGIAAIAATTLKQTGYAALNQGSFYQAKDVVAFAKHSSLRNFDAEKAAHATQSLVQSQQAGSQKPLGDVLKAYDHAAVAAYGNPADAAARHRFDAAGQRQRQVLSTIAKQGPEQEELVRKLEDAKKIRTEHRATVPKVEAAAEAKVQTTAAKAATAEQKTDALFAGLSSSRADEKRADAKAEDARSGQGNANITVHAEAASMEGKPAADAPSANAAQHESQVTAAGSADMDKAGSDQTGAVPKQMASATPQTRQASASMPSRA